LSGGYVPQRCGWARKTRSKHRDTADSPDPRALGWPSNPGASGTRLWDLGSRRQARPARKLWRINLLRGSNRVATDYGHPGREESGISANLCKSAPCRSRLNIDPLKSARAHHFPSATTSADANSPSRESRPHAGPVFLSSSVLSPEHTVLSSNAFHGILLPRGGGTGMRGEARLMARQLVEDGAPAGWLWHCGNRTKASWYGYARSKYDEFPN
jgi:hypothetical protein